VKDCGKEIDLQQCFAIFNEAYMMDTDLSSNIFMIAINELKYLGLIREGKSKIKLIMDKMFFAKCQYQIAQGPESNSKRDF